MSTGNESKASSSPDPEAPADTLDPQKNTLKPAAQMTQKQALEMVGEIAASMTVEKLQDGIQSGTIPPAQITALMRSGRLPTTCIDVVIRNAESILAIEEEKLDTMRSRFLKAHEPGEAPSRADKRMVRQQDTTVLRQKSAVGRLIFFRDLQKVPKLTPVKLILLVGWSLAMSSLDMSIVNICLPLIMHERNFVHNNQEISMSTLQWVSDIYSIAFAAFAIPASKIGDRFGVTVVHRWGVGGFVIMSALCGLSRYIKWSMVTFPYGGFYVLVGFRFLQGIFAAFLMANTMSLCGTLVEQANIPTSMALNGIAFAAATALGPTLGGVIGQYIGWDFCFFINIVIGVISMCFCWLYLPKTPKFKEAKFDWFGSIVVLVALLAMVLGLTLVPPDRELVPWAVGFIVFGFLALVGFVFWELKHPFPILPPGILKNRMVICSLLAGLWNFALITTVSFQVPFALQGIHQFTPSVVGFMGIVNPLAQICAPMVAVYLAKRVTSSIIKVVTSVLLAVAVILLGYVIPYDIPTIIIQNLMFSFFLGIFFTTNNQFMMQAATADVRGMLGGCIQTFREAGFAVGIALVNVIHDIYMSYKWRDSNGNPLPLPYPHKNTNPAWVAYGDTYYSAFVTTDWFMSLVSILAMVFGMIAGTGEFESHLLGYTWGLMACIQRLKNKHAKKAEYTRLLTEKETPASADDE